MTEKERKQIINNAHLKRDPQDKDLIIVKGDGKDSKRLKKAYWISKIGISKPGKNKAVRRIYITSGKFTDLTGLEGQISRGWRWIEGDEKVKKLIKVLNE
ncbi:MAG: hypothetical protein NTW55_05365 [Planctomycetota bacterium]|nr:hypothetical protein [Planctomycetota bacterium]